MTRRIRRRVGFSLIEVLVVVAIVAIAVAIALPAAHEARVTAKRAQCLSNLKQIGIAMHNYHSMHDTLPPGYIDFDDRYSRNLGWGVFLLPMIDELALYNDPALGVDTGQFPEKDHPIHHEVVPLYICPLSGNGTWNADLESTKSDYVGIVGNAGMRPASIKRPARPGSGKDNGTFFWNSNTRFADITDGTSNTVIIGEVVWDGTAIPKPEGTCCFNDGKRGSRWIGQYGHDLPTVVSRTIGDDPVHGDGWQINGEHPSGVGSGHAGGAQFLLGDGSARLINENISLATWMALGSIAESDSVGEY